MFGINVKLADGVTALGVMFEDESLYVHEPVSDTYASKEDLLQDLLGASIQIIGPVMPLQYAMDVLTENYNRNIAALDRSRAYMQDEYESALNSLKKHVEGAA